MRARGLAARLSLVIALLVMVSVGALGAFAVRASRQSLRDQALAANLTAATLAARAVEQYVTDASSIMREAPGRPKLGREVREANWPEAARVLENLHRHFPQFDYVFVQDGRGVIRARVPHADTVGQDFSFREFFREAVRTGSLHVSNAYVSRAARRPVVSIASPVLDGAGRVAGVLVGALSLRALSDVLSSVAAADAAELVLVDRNGALIARTPGARADLGEDLAGLPIVRALLAGRAGTMQFDGPDGHSPLLGAHVPIARLGWGVVATKPAAVAHAAADRLAGWLAGFAVLCAAAAVAAGWQLARALTRPLGRLASATDRLAAGDLEARVTAAGHDEIAALARSFNHMADQLRASYRDLERKTKEVEAANQELVEEITERRRAEEEVSRLNETLRRQLDELRRAQEQLVQSEKLATLGTLLASVAHELNNPMSVVLGHALLLRERPEPGVAERGAKISQAAERCARIIRGFLALARQQPPERGHVALNQVVGEALELLSYHLRVADVALDRRLEADLPLLWADAHQLHQVVVNLVTNAVDAMRPEGPRELAVATGLEAGRGAVVLEVADTGPGIPAEIRTRIFEPFFTTKPPGEGTGLGLALCRSIVEAHGGRIEVEARVPRGTRFRVVLPAAAGPAAAPRPAPAPVAATGGRRILVVDDELEVAEVLADFLAADGHRVETAGSAPEALARLSAGGYDLIISDVRMPGLDGPGFYRELERRHPELGARVVFLTGDVLAAPVRAFLDAAGRPEIAKPFDPATVRRVVRRALEGATG